MNKFKLAVIWLVATLYFVWPMDLAPGIIVDDVLVVIMAIAMSNTGQHINQQTIENNEEYYYEEEV